MRTKFKPWAKDYIKENKIFLSDEMIINKPFNNDNPIHLELGIGKGDFLIKLAKSNPNINYIGIEVQASTIVMAAKKIEEKEIKNLKLWNQDVSNLSKYIFLKNKIEIIYLNFSDPWPKNKHAKRRLTSDVFLPIYNYLLIENGKLKIKTDNDKLFESTILNLSKFNYLILDVSLDLHSTNKENIITEYETKFSQKGFKIKYLEAKKRV